MQVISYVGAGYFPVYSLSRDRWAMWLVGSRGHMRRVTPYYREKSNAQAHLDEYGAEFY